MSDEYDDLNAKLAQARGLTAIGSRQEAEALLESVLLALTSRRAGGERDQALRLLVLATRALWRNDQAEANRLTHELTERYWGAEDDAGTLAARGLLIEWEIQTRDGQHRIGLEIADRIVLRYGSGQATEDLLPVWMSAIVAKATSLAALTESSVAIDILDDAVDRFGNDPGVAVPAARALALKASLLAGAGGVPASLEARARCIALLRNNDAPAARAVRALALLDQAIELKKAGDLTAALELLSCLEERYADVRPRQRPHLAADALFLDITYSFAQKAYRHAIEAVERFRNRYDKEPALAVRMAQAYWIESRCYEALGGGPDHLLAALDRLIEGYGDARDPRVRFNVARALCEKGVVLRAHGYTDDALRCFDEVGERFGSAPSPAEGESVARALYESLVTHGELGEPTLAEAAGERLREQFQTQTDIDSTHTIGTLLLRSGDQLRARGEHEPALRLYSAADDKLSASRDLRLRTLGVRARLQLAAGLVELGRIDDAIATFASIDSSEPALAAAEQLEKLEDQRPGGPVNEQRAAALLIKLSALKAMNRKREAQATFEQIVSDYGDARSPLLQLIVAEAREP
jgi:tetratricopeptide (TPR) repeat protein